MRTYAICSRVTAILTVTSFAVILIFHYLCQGIEFEFWSNIALAIFGSSILAFITSAIGYFAEKRNALEGFWSSTMTLLHYINKYELNWELEKKIDFYLKYIDIDKSSWDSNFGTIYFLIDFGRTDQNYIYEYIYSPINKFNQEVQNHEFHFRWHKDGSGKNDRVMKTFVSELENMFMEKISVQNSFITVLIQNKLVKSILKELHGKYYYMIYHKNHIRN